MRASSLTLSSLAVLSLCLAAPADAQDDQLCLMCHAEASLFAPIHGQLGIRCAMCHQGYAGFPHPDDPPSPNCGGCHGTIQGEYVGSLHGYVLERQDQHAPTCVTCHGGHDILRSSDPGSPTAHANVPMLCAGLLTDHLVRLPQTYTAYAQSVHGLGEEGAARCTDCHGVHDLRGALDPASKINRLNVPTTCGQCHSEIAEEFRRSIHGRALRAGLKDSPTCSDCHGEHHILSPHDPAAHTYAARLAEETCGTCHNDPEIIQKYGLTGGVVGSYEDSYHGWTARRGYERAATCVSCHGAHSVLPESDSASTVHPANVVATCRRCHPRADRQFATSYTHATASITANPINRWIRNIYVVLIVMVIGGMLLHNFVVFNYYLIERRLEERKIGYVLRLDRVQLLQHLINAAAFIVLVITGFALRFPDAWWVRGLAAIGMSEPVRSNVHRIAAVVLLLVGVSHVWYVLFHRRGKIEFRAMWPRWRDMTDAVKNMLFHLRRTKEHPRFPRYDYTQKAEYWALVWGTAVMAITGFVLWFPVQAVRILPWWIVPASQTIHYYEAWLATLAILVWHMFFVIVHPDAYPMNWAWLTGRVPEKFVRQHHAEWYEEELAHPEARDLQRPGKDPRRSG